MTSNHLMIKGHCLQSQQKTNIIDISHIGHRMLPQEYPAKQ
jgi:hypothetical protein